MTNKEMNIELFTDGDWKNTHLEIDEKEDKYIKTIEIFIGDTYRSTISAGVDTIGTIPYGMLVNIRGMRYKEDNGRLIMSDGAPVIEKFEYRHVNVYRI